MVVSHGVPPSLCPWEGFGSLACLVGSALSSLSCLFAPFCANSTPGCLPLASGFPPPLRWAGLAGGCRGVFVLLWRARRARYLPPPLASVLLCADSPASGAPLWPSLVGLSGASLALPVRGWGGAYPLPFSPFRVPLIGAPRALAAACLARESASLLIA